MYSSSPKSLFKRTLHSHESDPSPVLPPSRNLGGSSLPPEFIERGEVTSGEEMTTRYTDEEWEGIIGEVGREVLGEEGEEGDEDGVEGEKGLEGRIDHTLLKLDAKEEEFDRLCEEAREWGFASVCVRPDHVSRCLQLLKNSPNTKVASVIGFHEGTHPLPLKISETRQSLSAGASELDIVINYPLLKQKSYSEVYAELTTLRVQAPPPTILKLILETSQLTREEIVAGCVLASKANFDFVKTSTGFCGSGATVEGVRLMRACCEVLAAGTGGGNDGEEKERMKVKASGGIRTLEDARKMIKAGAERLGCSAGVAIAREARGEGQAVAGGSSGGY